MKKLALIALSLVVIFSTAHLAYFYAYTPILKYRLTLEVDALERSGFHASTYLGPESRLPGIVVTIPYDWSGSATIFDDSFAFRNVIAISAKGQWISKRVLHRMATMPRLQELWLDQQLIGDEELRPFENHARLKVLGLFWTNISTASLATIGSLKNLEELDLRDTKIDPKQTRELCRNANLMDLRLWGIPVKDDDVRELTCLRRLKRLRLQLTEVSDKIADVLINFKNLETVDLNTYLLTDGLVSSLLKLPDLKEIQGDYCPKDDALIQEIGTRHIKIWCNDLFDKLLEIGKKSETR